MRQEGRQSEAMTATDVFPATHAVFPGHFEGRPIVPGALLMARVTAAVADAFPEMTVTGIRRAKFVRTLGPDETFEIELFPPSGSGLRFRVAAAGDTVAEGQIVVSAPPQG